MKHIKETGMMAAVMLIFGTIGLFRRLIPLGSATVASFRGIIGGAALIVYMAVTRRKTDTANLKRHMTALILSGICIAANWILLFEAYNYTSIAVATVCYYMAPVFVLIMVPIFFRERITLTDAAAIAVSLVGMGFISGLFSGDSMNVSVKGILFGLGAALLYACVMMINRKLTEVDSFEKTVVQLLTAGIFTFPYAVITDTYDASVLNTTSILIMLFVGILHTAVAYAMYFKALAALPIQKTALMGYIDPATAILLSSVFLRENIGIFEWIGIILILAAVAGSEIIKNAGRNKHADSV